MKDEQTLVTKEFETRLQLLQCMGEVLGQPVGNLNPLVSLGGGRAEGVRVLRVYHHPEQGREGRG